MSKYPFINGLDKEYTADWREPRRRGTLAMLEDVLWRFYDGPDVAGERLPPASAMILEHSSRAQIVVLVFQQPRSSNLYMMEEALRDAKPAGVLLDVRLVGPVLGDDPYDAFQVVDSAYRLGGYDAVNKLLDLDLHLALSGASRFQGPR